MGWRFYTDCCVNKMAVIVTGSARSELGSLVMSGIWHPGPGRLLLVLVPGYLQATLVYCWSNVSDSGDTGLTIHQHWVEVFVSVGGEGGIDPPSDMIFLYIKNSHRK